MTRVEAVYVSQAAKAGVLFGKEAPVSTGDDTERSPEFSKAWEQEGPFRVEPHLRCGGGELQRRKDLWVRFHKHVNEYCC